MSSLPKDSPAFMPEWRSLSRLEHFLNSATQIGKLSLEEAWECSRQIEEGALAHHAICIRTADDSTRREAFRNAVGYARTRAISAFDKQAVLDREADVLGLTEEYIQQLNTFTNTTLTSACDLNRKTESAQNAVVRLVESNVKLLIKPALSFCNPTYPIEDVVQEGVPLLFTAAAKFHYRRQKSFSTFAVPVLRNGYISLWRKGTFTAPPVEYKAEGIEEYSEAAADPESVFIAEENVAVLLEGLSQSADMDTQELHAVIAMHGLLGGPESNAASAAHEIGIPFRAMERVRARANEKLRAAPHTTQMQNILRQIWQ